MPSIRRQTGSRLVSSWLVEFPDNEAVKLLGIRLRRVTWPGSYNFWRLGVHWVGQVCPCLRRTLAKLSPAVQQSGVQTDSVEGFLNSTCDSCRKIPIESIELPKQSFPGGGNFRFLTATSRRILKSDLETLENDFSTVFSSSRSRVFFFFPLPLINTKCTLQTRTNGEGGWKLFRVVSRCFDGDVGGRGDGEPDIPRLENVRSMIDESKQR